MSIQDLVEPSRVIRLTDTAPPVLFVVIDTEEERSWGAYSRSDFSVNAIRKVSLAQKIFDEYKIRPVYVIDYPVASQPNGFQPLKEIADDNRAVIGTHLHPWVNPPYDEELCARNTYPGNLDPRLEAAKLRVLTETIGANFGSRPTIYKAGRYGIGSHTAAILQDLGYEIDVSMSPPFDYSADGGPDFSGLTPDPRWFGKSDRLLELPVTGAFVGYLHRHGPRIHPRFSSAWAKRLHLGGIALRAGALNRLRLSPEKFTSVEHKKLTQSLLRRGTRVFSWTFHSPSLEPGHSPYVRNNADLDAFLASFHRYFAWFFGELGGVAMTPGEFLREARNGTAQTVAV